jgi:hypothetical protein
MVSDVMAGSLPIMHGTALDVSGSERRALRCTPALTLLREEDHPGRGSAAGNVSASTAASSMSVSMI